MPYWGAAFSVLGMRVFDSQVLAKKSCPRYLAAAAIVGFCIGAQGANTLQSSLWRSFDSDIQRAFDRRFMKHALNVSGLGSNHTSLSHSEDNNDFSKPY